MQVLLALLLAEVGSAARILALFHYSGPSHSRTLHALTRGLAGSGHHVTVLSHYALEHPPENYTHISIAGSKDFLTSGINLQDIQSRMPGDGGLTDLFKVAQVARTLSLVDVAICRTAYEHPAVAKLIKRIRAGEKFDLLVTHTVFRPCFDAFARLLGEVPLVSVATTTLLPAQSFRVANPHNPAYISTYYSPYETGNMSLYDRLINTLLFLLLRWMDRVMSNPSQGFPAACQPGSGLPQPEGAVIATNLLLVNTHHSISGAVPLQPNVIEVGGIHLREPHPLTEDMEKFLSGAEHGVVVFSWGSLLALHTLPLEKLEAVLEALSRLPQRVVLKCDVTKLPRSVTIPNNVLAAAWVPQADILADTRVRAFVTHGGMHSLLEAVQFGVPLVGVPITADQKITLRRLQTLGVAINLEYQKLSSDTLLSSLTTVINDKRYCERAKQLSRVFWDRPRPPLEEAVYWVEYVLRHQGAPHLRSAALDLAWYQYLLIDVIAAIAIILLITALPLCLWKYCSLSCAVTQRTRF